MLRQYLVPLLTFCAMLAIDGAAGAATKITQGAPPSAAAMTAVGRALPVAERISGHPLTLNQGVALKVAATRVTQALPPIPTELQSMQLLYGKAYTKRGSVVGTPDPHGTRVNKEHGYHHIITEYVTPWLTATAALNGSIYFIATVKAMR